MENYLYFLVFGLIMPRGRPIKSEIRQNIIDILSYMGKAYGYEIYKVYKAVFPKATMRVLYYHLKKGLALNEFKVENKEKVEGDYSWGHTAEKTYYSIGAAAKPRKNERIKETLNKK